jgi:undecaprenyl-diphosphatase
MPVRVFVPYDVVGAGAWATTFCVLGYVFWRSFDRVTRYVSRGLFAFATVVAVAVGLYLLVQLRRDPQKLEAVKTWLREREDRRLMRPLVRVAGPVWRRLLRPAAGGVDATARFGLDRVTPGHLGLELTSLLALAAVGGFAFALIGEALEAPGEPRADRFAFSLEDHVRVGVLDAVMKVVTQLGSLPVTATLTLLTAAWAARGRRWVDAAALVAGMGLSYAAVHVAKAAYDRPRPAAPLVDTALSSYPSGHALYAVALMACTTVLVRAGSGWAVRSAAGTVSVVAVVVVAVSRVYLRAHFLTDVLGGVGLGVAIWSVVGIAALFAGHVRHNGPPT